eukprot:GFKZ01004778.1.p2 GENE.GFKZ01004778.1~~GFKZ01004778.1.p2  ORF type:complete len:109 (-),score=8.76 GFKZ01004778.1:673-999(-)
MDSSHTELGGPLQAVLQLVLASVLYERYVRRRSRSFAETPWVAVYVLATPLLFGESSWVAMLGLFCTRFVVEAFLGDSMHWAVAVSTPARDDTRLDVSPELYQPLLPD